MGLISVDREKCAKDGFCARECPMAIIRLQEKDGYPEMVAGGEEICNQCGHCVAVCPHGALNHALVPLESCPPIREEWRVSEGQALQFLRSRRTIRFFVKERPVEREILQKLIETARYAPTGSNSQLVEWTVFTDKAQITELSKMTVEWMRSVLRKDPKPAYAPYLPMIVAAWDAGYDIVLRNAPAVVVASAPRQDPNGLVDVTLALTYLELAAMAKGLGSCWAGLLQGAMLSSPQLEQGMGIPDGHPHHYPMMLGYPKPKYFRLPERKAPKIHWK